MSEQGSNSPRYNQANGIVEMSINGTSSDSDGVAAMSISASYSDGGVAAMSISGGTSTVSMETNRPPMPPNLEFEVRRFMNQIGLGLVDLYSMARKYERLYPMFLCCLHTYDRNGIEGMFMNLSKAVEEKLDQMNSITPEISTRFLKSYISACAGFFATRKSFLDLSSIYRIWRESAGQRMFPH